MKKLLLAAVCVLYSMLNAQTVNLYAPANGTNLNGINATLQWIDVAGETGFAYQVDTVNTFDSPNLISGTVGAYTSGTGFPAAGVGNLMFGTTYYWRVAAIMGTAQAPWSNVRNFNTISQPVRYAPANAETVNIDPILQWYDVAGESGYIYQLDTVNTFDSANLQSGTVGAFNTSGYPSAGVGILPFGTTFYWRVAILNGASQSNWSSIGSFTTIDRPVLYSPSNEQLMNGISIILQWYNYSSETGYKYEVDSQNTFDSPNLISGTTPAMTSSGYPSVGVGGLAFGTTYFWRVSILSAAGQSEWSFVRSFTTVANPTLNAPANGTVNVGSSVSLTWYNIAGESGFAYQLDTSPEFNSANLQSGTLGEYTSTIGFPGISFNNLLPDTTYFWRIAFLNNAMQSQWSPTWIFGTGATILANTDYEPTGFTAYPNPTADKIYLAGEGLESAQYCLIGTDGRVLLERASGDAALDLEAFPQGIYFLKINRQGKSQTLKIVRR